AYVVVSHDRYFLGNVASRMLELSRAYAGGLLEAEGSYSAFLEKRDEVLRGQAAYEESLASAVRREVEWLRRKARARTTKAQARVKEAHRRIDELAQARARATQAAAAAGIEQDRDTLDLAVSLKRALAPESDSVVYDGRPVHVSAWARRFLFRTEQLETPVGRLSGGEKARILIARLMLAPADLLILDEPTNDLDIPTLEVLEDNLAEFPGALVLVTHDRLLLDRVSTSILA